MDLSAYSLMPGYLNNMGTMLSARTNLAIFQPNYASYSMREIEPMEQMVERKIKEGILAAVRQIQ
jgi:hypothetical protein